MAKGMMIYEAEMEVLLSLEEDNRSHIITALICDRLGKEVPSLNPMENAVFTLIREQTKRAAKLSNTRSDSANARWENNNNGMQNEAIGDQDNQESSQKNTNDKQNCTDNMQSGTSNMQTVCKDNTSPCTNTNTNTNTNTQTNTNTSKKKLTGGNIKGGMGGEISDALSPDNVSKKRNLKPLKKTFGEYRHIKLTEEQHEKLIADFGEALIAEYIRRCDEYVQSRGPKKAYNDYNLALRQWLKRDGHKPRGQPKEEEYDPYSEPIF